MSNLQNALMHAPILAAVVALAGVATAASGQPDPEPIDRQSRHLIAGALIADPSQKAEAGHPPASPVHHCRFRIEAHDRNPIAGLDIVNDLAAEIDRTVGMILVGNSAPEHLLATTYSGADYLRIPDWKFSGSGTAGCTLLVLPGGKSANFRDCARGLNGLERGSIY